MESPQHATSPESAHNGDGQQSTRKRKRKTFSCDTCRKRKLKCDRELPVCGRCQKSGNAAACVYENPPHPASRNGDLRPLSFHQMSETAFQSQLFPEDASLPSGRHNYPSPNHQAERLAALESRIARIDPKLAISDHIAKRPRLDPDASTEPAIAKEKDSFAISFYGAGFKTGFFGPSSERNAASYCPAILKLYPELKAFVSFNNLQHPLFAQVRTHIYAIRKNSKLAKKMLPYPPATSPFDTVPDKETCTKSVTLYWETIASTYHIFHGPTFWSTYWLYWSDAAQRTEAFACIILLMLACVNPLEQRRPFKYRGLSNVAREQASYWIDTCESWISRQSRKHLSIESFQNRILLVIAKQINAIKRKQVWERASELFALAISTGLHQDPSKIDNTYIRDQAQSLPIKPKTTPYEREMRRRLWAAVVELEMQASIDKGVPSSRLALLADCGRPTLLADDQFEISSSALPPPELRSNYTTASYLHLSQESLRIRASLADIVNTGLEHLTYDEILEYDEQIRRNIAALPDWAQSSGRGSNLSSNKSTVPAALLELQLLQFQLLLHIPTARRIEKDSRTNLSRMSCIDTAVRILEIHLRLSQSTSGTSENHWLNLIREDVFRAIIGVCYNLVVWRGLNSDLSSVWMKDIYIEHAVQGLDYFRQKVVALGDHYVQMWYTLAAVGMLRASFAISDVNLHVTTIADELTAIFGSVCNSQEEPSNEQTAAGALTALAIPNSGGYDVAIGATPLPLPDLASTQPFLDGVDMNGWGGFDDLWPFSNTGLSW